MVEINEALCIGCNACVEDCFPRNLSLSGGQAKVHSHCMNCGHCVAICPTRAISISEYSMEDVTEYQSESFDIPADTLLNFIRFRRSIRRFKRKPIEDEKIAQIIEAGRFTPTGANRQNVRYIVVKEQLQPLRKSILKKLGSLDQEKSDHSFIARYSARFRAMYKSYVSDPFGEDQLFFHAPAVLLVVSDDPLPAALASTSMELQANALGLGCLYSGFSTYAINADEDCTALLKLSKQEKVVTALVLGYPDVTYRRTAPRKTPDITIL